MAFNIKREEMENDTGGDFVREEKYIPAGTQQARLVSYVELGKHVPLFMGKHAVYGKDSKKAGQPKPPEFMIQLVFEFPRAEYTGSYPLTIKTSVPYGSGDFINKLGVSDALMSGNISMKYANKSKYMKYLNNMNESCGTQYDSLSDFVGEPFMIAVTNKPGTKADADGNLPMYSNMNPEGITSVTFPDPMGSGKLLTADVPPQMGEYCGVFSWDEPTPEAWQDVPKYLKACIKGAVDFPGSPVEAMLAGMPAEAEPESNTPPENKGKAAVPADDVPV